MDTVLKRFSLDFETRSEIDLREVGAWNYADHPSTEVLMYAFTDRAGAVISVMGAELRPELKAMIDDGYVIDAWNATFEWLIINKVCARKHGWGFTLPPSRMRCTMARAAVMNLPQSLGDCAEVIGMPQDKQKDKRGKQLIQKLCKPQKATKTRSAGFNSDPVLMQEFLEYCGQDVVTEVAVAAFLRDLSPSEQEVWEFTLSMNDKGVPVAVDECEKIVEQVEREKERLDNEAMAITGGISVNQAGALARWLTDNGVPTDSIAAEAVDAMLKRPNVPDHARRVLEIRQTVAQTSTTKFAKMLELAHRDGTIKGMYSYHGASTGRWASRGGLNMQNLASPIFADAHACNEAFSEGDYLYTQALYGEKLMDAAVSAVRGVIKAPEGHEFIDADFSSVENRMSAFISGQQDKLDLFAAGLDEYKTFAANRMFRVPYEEVTAKQRKLCKPVVLGCFGADTVVLTSSGWKRIVDVDIADKVHDGAEWVDHSGVIYQGRQRVIERFGVIVTPDHKFYVQGEWVEVGSMSQMDGLAAVTTATATLPIGIKQDPRTKIPKSVPSIAGCEIGVYDILNAGPRHRFVIRTARGPMIVHNCMFGLGAAGLGAYAENYGVQFTDEESKNAVDAYRAEYDKVVKCWWACGDAAIAAIKEPGAVFRAGKHLRLKVTRLDSKRWWLVMRLPSGRCIYWFRPRIEMRETPWGAIRPTVIVDSVETKTRRWMTHPLIATSIFQSAVQGAARDLLAYGAMALERHGYDVRMLTHDEATGIVPQGSGDGDEFTQILCAKPEWAEGLPLAGEWWRSQRFRK